MEKKLNKIAKDTNQFLLKFLLNQKKTDLIKSMKYGLLPGGKKIRSKLIIDVGKIFKINYKNLIYLSAAVECIHAIPCQGRMSQCCNPAVRPEMLL